ncbi:hypothetical protein [Cohnella caldifontis]|uniref:hypothetical protein n=1 Tax=Cohnella caldifontis TaxID=3027471 RepID=UPI0023EBA12D|nr:hypothetical protein [Cohnella sp. YIM B05605]
MSAYAYQFESDWKLEADIHQVWEIIGGIRYHEWWNGISSRQIHRSGNPGGIGDKYEYVLRTKLPYQLSWTAEIVARKDPEYLEIRSTGELEGIGYWTLSQEGGVTHARYIWKVNTNKKWMNALAPVLRPAFVWNHDQVMKEGAKGLAAAMGVRLVSC